MRDVAAVVLGVDLNVAAIAQGLILLVAGAFFTFIVNWFMRSRAAAAEKAAAMEREAELWRERTRALENQLSGLKETIVPISTAMQALLVRELTHYHTPEMDELLDKLSPFTLSPDEELRLAELLAARSRDMGELITPAERAAASILPEIIRRARIESVVLDSPFKLQLLTVAKLTLDPPRGPADVPEAHTMTAAEAATATAAAGLAVAPIPATTPTSTQAPPVLPTDVPPTPPAEPLH